MNIKKIAIVAFISIAHITAPMHNLGQTTSSRPPAQKRVEPVTTKDFDASSYIAGFYYDDGTIILINKKAGLPPARFENVIALQGGVQHSRAELRSIANKIYCADGESGAGFLEYYGDLVS